jgi:type II secretory pathway pseudopilin PulG
MQRGQQARIVADRRDAGITLIETVVATILVAILGGVLTMAVATAVHSQKLTQDETNGLGDVRTAIEELGRDVRSARAVTCDGGNPDNPTDTTCQSHLQLWIDFNSNYRLDPNETVTWELIQAADGQHFEVIRTVGDVTRVVARSLIVKVAFSYDQPPTNLETSPTQRVTTLMKYDTLIGLGSNPRNVTFTERLRNVV